MIKSKQYITAREMQILAMRQYQTKDNIIVRTVKAIFSFFVLLFVLGAVIMLSVCIVPIYSLEKVFILFVIILGIFTYYINVFLPKFLNIAD